MWAFGRQCHKNLWMKYRNGTARDPLGSVGIRVRQAEKKNEWLPPSGDYSSEGGLEVIVAVFGRRDDIREGAHGELNSVGLGDSREKFINREMRKRAVRVQRTAGFSADIV